MIAGARQRAGCDEQKALGTGDSGIGIKCLRRHKVHDLGMLRRRLQILAHCQKIDIGAAHIVHHLMHFHPLFTQTQASRLIW